jgi:hypothetical protein
LYFFYFLIPLLLLLLIINNIVLLDAGKVIEYDTPYVLMQKPNGIFRGMCERSNDFNELFEIAKEKFNRDQKENGEIITDERKVDDKKE